MIHLEQNLIYVNPPGLILPSTRTRLQMKTIYQTFNVILSVY